MEIRNSTEGSGFECPFCQIRSEDLYALQIHVDEHIRQENEAKDREVAIALAGHSADPRTQEDFLVAQELERREREVIENREKQEFEALKEEFGLSENSDYRRQAEQNLERDLYNGNMDLSEFYTKKTTLAESLRTGVDEGSSCFADVLDLLKSLPLRRDVRHRRFCSNCYLYLSSYGDRGWGCGYRNIQMMLSCLRDIPYYAEKLFRGNLNMPSVGKIQELIEKAWQKGFDVKGAEQLNDRLVGTTKWIGATEVAAMFHSYRVRCEIVDFHRPTGPDGSHPRMLEWIRDYFNSFETSRPIPPLYLQHQGHSRTIVGYEESNDGAISLFIFDPSCSKSLVQLFMQNPERSGNLFRRTSKGLQHPQFQIVVMRGIVDSDAEFEERKVLSSTRIP